MHSAHPSGKYPYIFMDCKSGNPVTAPGVDGKVPLVTVDTSWFWVDSRNQLSLQQPCLVGPTSHCAVFCVRVNIERGAGERVVVVRGNWTGNVFCNNGNGWPKHFGRECSCSVKWPSIALWRRSHKKNETKKDDTYFKHTLLPSNRKGIGLLSRRETVESTKFFQVTTCWNDLIDVTSNMITHADASLKYTLVRLQNLSRPSE